jgi:hypothetical protein
MIVSNAAVENVEKLFIFQTRNLVMVVNLYTCSIKQKNI